MKALILRPLALFTIVFFVLSCILFTADTALRLWSAVIFVFLFALFFLLRLFIPSFRGGTKLGAVTLAVVFFFAGGALASSVSYHTMDTVPKAFSYLCSETVTVEGTVSDVLWGTGYSTCYKVKIKDEKTNYSVFCAVEGDGGVNINSTVRVTALFSSVKDINDADEKRYYLPEGIHFTAEAEELTVIKEGKPTLNTVAQYLRLFLSDIYIKYLGVEEGGFAAALILGEKGLLSPIVNRDFRRLGLSHVLAISGMHLTVICAAVSAVLSSLGKKWAQLGSILIVIFYMFLTGLSPSVTRSGIMVLVLIGASFLRHPCDSFTNLGIAGFLITFIDPYAAADVGLQLSFGAVFAILLYMPKRRSLYEKKEDKKNGAISRILLPLLESTVLTVIITLFMLPLQWLYFKEISLVSPLTSPLFSLGGTVLLWALPLLLLLSPVPPLCSALSFITKPLITLMISLANTVSRLRNIVFSLNYPFALIFSILIFIAVIAFCISKKKGRLAFGALLLSLTVAFGTCAYFYKLPDFDRAKAIMLEDKRSDGILLASDCRTMLIDIGNGFKGIYREGLGTLSRVQSTEIEAVMLTHLHPAHPSTLDYLFSSNIVRALIIPKEEGDIAESIREICEWHGVKLYTYSHGDTVNFEDCRIKTYGHKFIKRSNQPIIRLDISAFGETFTYLGGAYFESGDRISLENCDGLWLGTHGPLYKKNLDPMLPDGCKLFASDSAKVYISDKYSLLDEDFVILD